VSLLLRCGFLMRHPDSGGQYYVSIANAGTVVRSILNGRKVNSSYTSSDLYVFLLPVYDYAVPKCGLGIWCSHMSSGHSKACC